MRKVACLAVFMALMMLVPVQAGGDVSMQQTETEEEDPRQPTKENKTLYMFWDDSMTKAWTHFNISDEKSLEEYTEEKDNGEKVNLISSELAGMSLREAREIFERDYLMLQINRFGGNISKTSAFVEMERSALHRKLKSLGINSSQKINQVISKS